LQKTQIPDLKLLRKAQRGDQSAIATLVEDFLSYAHQIAAEHDLPQAEARSAAHAGILDAIKHYDPEIGTFPGYVTQQVRFCILRALRAYNRHIIIENAYRADQCPGEPAYEDDVAGAEIAEKRREFMAGEIAKLSPRDQIMVEAKLAGRSFKDVAGEIGCSVQLVKFICKNFFGELVVPVELKGAR